MFDNVSDFKIDFTPLLKNFNIKPVLTTVNNPKSNAPLDREHQLILDMLVTKDIDNKVFEHTDPRGETLAYIAWSIRDYYHHTIMAIPGQYVFGRDMLFNLSSFVD